MLEVDDSKIVRLTGQLAFALEDKAFDEPVERAAWKCHRELVLLTPKRWTGLTRRAWRVTKPADASRLIFNPSKVMLFLEGGTGNAGTVTSNGGYIYPRTKRVLFIPLNARAALNGWSPSLVRGRDFVFARRVRGIKARHIVQNYREKARENLKAEMKAFLQKALT